MTVDMRKPLPKELTNEMFDTLEGAIEVYLELCYESEYHEKGENDKDAKEVRLAYKRACELYRTFYGREALAVWYEERGDYAAAAQEMTS